LLSPALHPLNVCRPAKVRGFSALLSHLAWAAALLALRHSAFAQ
jgi:hypothetical protein